MRYELSTVRLWEMLLAIPHSPFPTGCRLAVRLMLPVNGRSGLDALGRENLATFRVFVARNPHWSSNDHFALEWSAKRQSTPV